MPSLPRFSNSILRALPPDSIQRLALRPIAFEIEHQIEFPGNSIDNIFFVEEGMASMTTTFSDGAQVEVGMFGYESIIGVSALMGTRRSLNRVYTQIAGSGFSTTVDLARTEFQLGGRFQSLALAYVQAQLVQTMQSVGCNAKHDVDQRLARWLLLCADRAHRNDFLMSHEFLSDMLGSSRPTVSVAAAILKEAGIIQYTRGRMNILDVAALETRSCECYQVIKSYLDNYADFDHGAIAATPPTPNNQPHPSLL